MITNANITLYSKKHTSSKIDEEGNPAYKRHFIRGVNWQGELRASVSDKGLETADSIKVFIPLSACRAVPKKNDIVVKGESYMAAGMNHDGLAFRNLKINGDKAYKVISVRKRDNGSAHMRHWELELV